MKNILIPTDFSKEQNSIIEYGLQLSGFYNCMITLVHTILPAQSKATYMSQTPHAAAMPVESMEMQQIRIEAAEKYFKELLENLEKEKGLLPKISTKIEIGFEYNVISKMVKQENVDLVLLRGYDNDGFLKYLSDDRMDVVEEVNVPVLLVPPMASVSGFKRVVYASDYKMEDVESINQLVDLVKPFFGEIYGIHIRKESNMEELAKEEGFEKILKEKIAYNNISVYSISQDNVSDGVLKFAEESGADLISVLRDDKGFFERIFNKDKAKKIARKSDLPVLIFNE